jgi:hypothetical protein
MIPLARPSDASGLAAHSKHLPIGRVPPTWAAMFTREQWRWFIDHPVVEWSIFVIGVVLILLSPVAGVIPGPGGIFVFAIGLAMVLKTSMWAKRYYVKFKRWQPKVGRWADWGLRRRSARRREAVRKRREEIGCPPPPDEQNEGPISAAIPGPPVKQPELPGDPER